MKTFQVYDPPMCCSSGVCGPEVDPKLVRFSADFHWLANQGVAVERYNLSQQPLEFAGNPAVKSALDNDGTACLPLILVNGNIVSKGRYPERDELARFLGMDEPARPAILPVLGDGSCKPGSGCC
ncbi:MAG: arsenite efflux transporter metallochaperone ArsD [Acidobacteriia bacterium]|nr:arsenite efflux transporter metallochaperone ArsD [Terriglobia bacterium]